MGRLLKSFTYPRNAFAAAGAVASANETIALIARARSNALLQKPQGGVEERFNDSKQFLGVVRNGPEVTAVGEQFLRLAAADTEDAWRWLVTRAMWRYSVPNGSNAQVNTVARELGVTFNFFDLIARTCWMLSGLPHLEDVLYFDELLPILDDDAVWGERAVDLFNRVVAARPDPLPPLSERRTLLGDLEEEFAKRDNMNRVFKAGFGQSGLFDVVTVGSRLVGIRVSDAVPQSPVLWRRFRHVIDNPCRWTPPA